MTDIINIQWFHLLWMASFMNLSKIIMAYEIRGDTCDVRWHEFPRQDLCGREVVHLHCQLWFCVCYRDDPSFFIPFGNRSSKKDCCSWLNVEYSKREKCCKIVSDGRLIPHACKKSWKICRSYVTGAPSASPTTSTYPPAAPSLRPSVPASASPSGTPSSGEVFQIPSP